MSVNLFYHAEFIVLHCLTLAKFATSRIYLLKRIPNLTLLLKFHHV
jgi:hypothetical protein